MTAPEWVKGEWTAGLKGKTVQLRSDLGVLTGVVFKWAPQSKWLQFSGSDVYLYGEHWSLFIEKPAVVLPTANGSVVTFDRYQNGEPTGGAAVRTGETGWLIAGNGAHVDDRAIARMIGLKILRPEAEVAAEVLAEVFPSLPPSHIYPAIHARINAIAAKWATK